MNNHRILAAIVALGTATGAAAQSSNPFSGPFSAPNDFFIDGYVDLSYLDSSGGSSQTLFATSVDMGFPPAGGLGLGFSLGIDLFAIDGSGFSDQNLALYPTMQFGTQIGTFSAGIPRSVLDRGYMEEHMFARSPLFDLEFTQINGSILRPAYLFGDDIPYGLRYDGTFGSTRIGASYHRVDISSGNVDILGLAFRHELAAISSFYNFAIFGGLEYVDTPTNTDTSYRLGVEGGSDTVNAGLVLADNDGLSTVTVFGDYRFNDFTLHGSVLNVNPSGGSSTTLYGLGVEYSFFENAYVGLGAIDSTSSGSDPIYELSIGWRF